MTQPTTPTPRGTHIHESGFEVSSYRRMLEATETRQNLASQREEQPK